MDRHTFSAHLSDRVDQLNLASLITAIRDDLLQLSELMTDPYTPVTVNDALVKFTASWGGSARSEHPVDFYPVYHVERAQELTGEWLSDIELLAQRLVTRMGPALNLDQQIDTLFATELELPKTFSDVTNARAIFQLARRTSIAALDRQGVDPQVRAILRAVARLSLAHILLLSDDADLDDFPSYRPAPRNVPELCARVYADLVVLDSRRDGPTQANEMVLLVRQ